jgi:hypothetical protein
LISNRLAIGERALVMSAARPAGTKLLTRSKEFHRQLTGGSTDDDIPDVTSDASGGRTRL